jgi:transcriptional regulator
MLILKTLQRGPQHGFGIAERIMHFSNGALKVGEGSLYPALYRLQDRGFIQSEWGQSENNRKAKYYRLTAKGRKQLDLEKANWSEMVDTIAQVMKFA